MRLRVNPAGLFVSDGSFLRATQTVEVKFIKSKSHARYIFSHGYSLYFFSFLLIYGGFGVGVLGLELGFWGWGFQLVGFQASLCKHIRITVGANLAAIRKFKRQIKASLERHQSLGSIISRSIGASA